MEIESVTRKLASVRRIAEIEEIPGADNIVCATVDGWKLVTQRSNNFVAGDLVIYFEIDSFLPVIPEFEFLRKSSFKSTKNLGDGFRIKTIRLRGQVSQGLILPAAEFNVIIDSLNKVANTDSISINHNSLKEGDDLTECFKVQKYEKPIPSELVGRVRGNFPMFIRKTDEERLQNIYNRMAHKYSDTIFEATMKLDGSSMTVYKNNGIVSVCSRNLDLMEFNEEGVTNTFWKAARESGLIDYMENHVQTNIAIQGELMGPGIQNNREGFKDHIFFMFNIWDIDNQEYFTPEMRMAAYLNMTVGNDVDISHAPVIGMSQPFMDYDSLAEFLEASEIPSITHPVCEGIVYKSINGDVSFKVISNTFLLKEKD